MRVRVGVVLVIRRWFARRRGHSNPTPAGQARLVVLTDYWWPTYLGVREWCDGKLRPCPYPGCGRCCACRHTEHPTTT